MNGKNQNEMRVIILALVAIIATIIVIVIVNRNNSNAINQGKKTNNNDLNFTESADGTKTNVSQELLKNKQVGDVVLEQSKIVYNNGTSLLTSKVTNNGIAKDNLSFKVKFIANDGSVMAEAVGYVGKINANETKIIDSYITIDTSNSKDVTYELVQ